MHVSNGTCTSKFSFSRSSPSVYYQNDKQPVLTINDKNLMKLFTCKSPWNLAGTLLAFGAGVLVGALLLSNPIGWVILGAAIVVAGVITTIVAINHSYSGPLKAGHWLLAHNSVRINESAAITRSSILKCGTGGVLTPFLTKQVLFLQLLLYQIEINGN